MFSYEILNDGKYHTVQLLSVMKNFTLRVDGGLARSIVNEGDNEFLQVEDQLLFLLVLISHHIISFPGSQVNVPGWCLRADWGAGVEAVASKKRHQFQRMSQRGQSHLAFYHVPPSRWK